MSYESLQYSPTTAQSGKELLRLVPQELWSAFLFLITLSLLGLELPLAYLFLPAILLTTYIRNRYDFLIQFTILCGAYGFFNESDVFPFKWKDLALLLSVVAIIIYRRDKVLNRLLLLTGGYIAMLIVFAQMSSESMGIQFLRMRDYCMIVYFMFPMLLFSRETFDIKIFYRKLFTYAYIIAIFYCIDSFILGGNILVPRTYAWSGLYSTYYKIYCDIGAFPRKYPQGLFILALCIFPALKFYTLQRKHLFIFALALIVSRTFSIIGGIVLTILFFTGNAMRTIKYLCIGIILFFAAYHLDGMMDGQLRVQQLVRQFTALKNMDDPEAIAEFGTGRMAQIIPKVDHLWSLGKQYTGFGFLHDEKTTNEMFIIKNELYTDISRSEEVAARVEVTQIQTILDIGLIGLLFQTIYFIGIYFWVLRPLPYSKSYLVVLVCISLFGLGGFAGLTSHHGVLLVGLCIGTILLASKNKDKTNIASPIGNDAITL